MTNHEDATTVGPLVLRLTEGLGAGVEARCWCHACRPDKHPHADRLTLAEWGGWWERA